MGVNFRTHVKSPQAIILQCQSVVLIKVGVCRHSRAQCFATLLLLPRVDTKLKLEMTWYVLPR